MKAFTRPRPIRIAFLVEESEDWKATIDAVIANCYGRWGGRFSLIVPYVEGQIVSGFDAWLESYDPDVIYSYVQLTAKQQAELRERLSPSFIIIHKVHDRGRLDAFHPRLPVAALGSLAITVAASQGGQMFGPNPIRILDCHPGVSLPRFVQDNFGFYQLSHDAWPIAADMQPFVQPLLFATAEIVADKRMLPRTVGSDIITDHSALLDRIGTDRTMMGLASLSAWQAPRLEIRSRKWGDQIIVVVGNYFADHVIFWNARSLQPAWLDSGFVTLKVDPSSLEDATFVAQLQKIIKNRISMPVGNQSNASIKLVSASVPADQLAALCERFALADRLNAYEYTAGLLLADVCPSERELEQAYVTTDGAAFFQSGDWHEMDFSSSSFKPLLVSPIPVRNASASPSVFKKGAWIQEIDIEREVNHSNLSNVNHHWRLPRRLSMTDAFCKPYQIRGRAGEMCMPRTTGGGILAIFSAYEATLPEIKLPSDENVFRLALSPPRFPLPEGSETSFFQRGAFDVRPSDKGRYLKALMRMANGVTRAREIFLHGFWKHQFEMVGATTSVSEARTTDVVNKLRKKLKSGLLETDDQWDRLATLVLAEARAERFSRRYLRFDELTTSFDTYRNNFWSKNEPGTPREEWEGDEKRSLGVSIQYLCTREILHQGVEWLCRKCNNNNWVSIDDIKKRMACEVCDASQVAPVADPWHFRLNNFVRDGMREHGLLAHIWCLARLEGTAKVSFFFLEPHELFWSDESADREQPDSELDLLAVSDGVVRLCEIKTSNKGIDIKKFAELAVRLRPDIATLAVMEPKSAALEKIHQTLTQLLEGTGIAAELITLNPGDIDDGPNLPTGRTFRVRIF